MATDCFLLCVQVASAGRHEEFPDLIVYLLSARASYITGATINADGWTGPSAATIAAITLGLHRLRSGSGRRIFTAHV